MSPERNMNNPYVGPRPFERNEDDSVRFFGRTQETQEIVSLIFGHPILLVYAQSGAGKTSLFNASIATTLENDGFDVLPITRVRGGVPENISIEETRNLYIFNALLNMEPEADPQVFVTKTLASYLETRPRENDESGQPIPRVLIFDQFEELFTVTTQDWLEQRQAFFHQITEALTADPLLRVVLVIREDFLAQLDPYAWMLPERLRTRYRLERLQDKAALQAIKAPLSGTTRSFAPDVAESLVKELLFMRTVNTAGEMTEIAGQYVEPVQLQVVCLTLWSSLPPDCTVITQEHLKGFDVSVALSDFYNAAIQAVVQNTGVEEANVRNWFGKTLITPMETRSTVYRSEDTTGGIPNNAVDLLEGRHLIRAEYRAGVRWYELTHDRFIEAILADNEEWFTKRQETLRNPIATAALDWDRLGKDEGTLLQGAILDEANAWVQNHPNELNDLELSFLRASQEHYQRDLESKAKRARTFRALTVALAIALVIVGFATGYALKQSNTARMAEATAQAALADEAVARADAEDEKAKADKERDRAIAAEAEARAGQLALQAAKNLESDPQLSLLLAIEAVKLSHTFASDDALRQALATSSDDTQKTLPGHDTAVLDVDFNLEGDLLISQGEEGAILWDFSNILDIDKITSINLESPDGHYYHGRLKSGYQYELIDSLEPSPDGNRLALNRIDEIEGSPVSLVDILNLPDESVKASQAFTNQIIYNMALNEDGNLVAILSVNYYQLFIEETLQLWNVSDDTTTKINPPTTTLNGVVFSPDGKQLATSGKNYVYETGVVQLWDVSAILDGNDEQEPELEIQSQATLFNTVFTEDGKTLISGSQDGTIRFWDVSDGTERAVLRGHEGAVYGLALFGSEEDESWLLASGDAFGNVRLWDIRTALETGGINAEVSILRGHNGAVYSVTFSSDGRWLISAGADETLRLWMTDPVDLLGKACQQATRNLTQAEWDSYIGSNLTQTEWDLLLESNMRYRETCTGTGLRIQPSVIDTMVDQGKEYVRQDKIDEALEIWEKIYQLDLSRDLDPNKEVAQVLIELGKKRAFVGEVDQALENLRLAAELDPTLELESEKIVANELFKSGYESAQHGDVDKGLDVLRQAIDLDPNLNRENESVEAIFAEQLIDEVKENPRLILGYEQFFDFIKGKLEDQDLLKIETAHKLVEFVNEQPGFRYKIEIEAALEALSVAVEFDPEIEVKQATDLVDAYIRVCRPGVFVYYRSPELIMPACQRAVELAEDSEYNFIGAARDSRGLALTMNGDYAGAIEDFEFFIQWARENNIPNAEALISQREIWIEKLDAGKNPFLEESPNQILIIINQLIP